MIAKRLILAAALFGGLVTSAEADLGEYSPAFPLYVGDRTTAGNVAGTGGPLRVFNSSGTQVTTYSSGAQGTTYSGVGYAEGIAVDPRYIYAANTSGTPGAPGTTGLIDVVSKSTGTFVGSLNLGSNSEPIGLAVSQVPSNGHPSLYVVADSYGQQSGSVLERWSANGTASMLVKSMSLSGGGFGVAVTPDGHVLVTENEGTTHSVLEYNSDLSGTPTTLASVTGSGHDFTGISVDPKTGNFFVSDLGGAFGSGTPETIREYNPSGTQIASITEPSNSYFTAVGPDGNLYAAFIGTNTGGYSGYIEKITLSDGVLTGAQSTFIPVGTAGDYPKSLAFDVTTVPEPSSLPVVVACTVGAVGYTWRRRKQAA